ncbi:MAG: DUF6809 family protein [Clostridia bacterium]|jgi:hypothetical protein
MTDTDIILKLYETMLEEKPTKHYKKNLEILKKAKQDFINHLENQNIDSLDELCSLAYDLNDDLNKQMFYRGISIGIKLTNFNLDSIEQ